MSVLFGNHIVGFPTRRLNFIIILICFDVQMIFSDENSIENIVKNKKFNQNIQRVNNNSMCIKS